MLLGGKKLDLVKMKSDLERKIGQGEEFTDAEIGVALYSQTEVMAHLLAAIEGMAVENKNGYDNINKHLNEITKTAWEQREEDLRRFPNHAAWKLITWLGGLIGAGLVLFSGYLWVETQRLRDVVAAQNSRLDVLERLEKDYTKRVEQLELWRKP